MDVQAEGAIANSCVLLTNGVVMKRHGTDCYIVVPVLFLKSALEPTATLKPAVLL